MLNLAFSLNSKVVEKYSIDMKALNDKLSEEYPNLSISLRIRKNLDVEEVQDIIASVENDSRVSKQDISSVIGEIRKSLAKSYECQQDKIG